MTAAAASEPLRLLLAELPARFPLERIDRVWVFTPREVNGRESGLVVLSLLADDRAASPELRQLVTVGYEAERAGGAVRRTDSVVEQGWAPADRMTRLIAGVLHRLGAAQEAEPAEEQIAGDPARWTALLERLAAQTG